MSIVKTCSRCGTGWWGAGTPDRCPVCDDPEGQDETPDPWLFSLESAAQLIAATSWPFERVENREAWAPKMITNPKMLATEYAKAMRRLRSAHAALAAPSVPTRSAGFTPTGATDVDVSPIFDDEDAPEGQPEGSEPIHWVGDALTSLHGNGAASFARTTREPSEVTCKLCRTLFYREPPAAPDPVPVASLPDLNVRAVEDTEPPAPVPDDEAVEALAKLVTYAYDEAIRTGRTVDVVAAERVLEAGFVSPEAHAQAVREAVRAERERIAEAIDGACLDRTFMSDAEARGWWKGNEAAARIVRDLTREAVE